MRLGHTARVALARADQTQSQGREEKLEVLQKWINMDVPALAVATVQARFIIDLKILNPGCRRFSSRSDSNR